MPVDLYTTDLNTVGGADLHAAIEGLLRMSAPINERLPESWMLDYKEQWTDEMLKHAAAFANTFGGLLIVGVKEEAGRPKDIVGVQTTSELKTQIASGISANISPTPSFTIAECASPNDPNRRVAVVRIRNVNKLHYYMKGDKPVYVRNEDESRPANAAQLRSLVEQRTGERSRVDIRSLLQDVSKQCYVSRAPRAGTIIEMKSNRSRSRSFFTVLARPTDPLTITVDASVERLFDSRVAQNFPEIRRRVHEGVAELEESRGPESYEMSIWQPNLDFEIKWLFSPREIVMATQVRVPISGFGECWSVADLALNISFLLRLAGSVWSALGFYGGARIGCELSIHQLQLYRENSGFYSIFYNSQLLLPLVAISGGSLIRSTARAELEIEFISAGDDTSAAVSTLTNQLLRGLGYSADLNVLRANIMHMLQLAG